MGAAVDLRQKLNQARNAYIDKYRRDPNVIFISNSFYGELDKMVGGLNLYDTAPRHLWGANVIVVLTPDYIKFAEDSDVRKAAQRFHSDGSWDSYKVPKTRTTIGSVNNGVHMPSEIIELEPIEFSKEEIEIYLMQN